ncbi:unnamed protein product [Symbiodinium sp. CCMP2456]|nr:unnamed protein product [Symbiodinium sp. CCMP2456]
MFYNILDAAAEAAFNVDRRRLQQSSIRAVALAEDARGGFELLKVRYVMADWSVHCRMLDLAVAEKAALDKSRSLPDTLASFLPEQAVRNAFKDKIRVFMADGEFSEPLAARLSKVQGTLPGLKAIMRCSVHSGQRALEKALATDPDVQVLVKSWVLGFSDGSGKNPGGFCRAVRNSQKLQRLTAEKQLEVLDESLRRLSHFGFAPQRFNTVCDACVNVAENIEAVCNVLSHLAAVDDQLSGWATELLQKCFQPEKKFTHSLDGSHLRLASTAHNLQQLECLINRLFDFRSPAGEMQQPLVLDDSYAHGYVQRLQATLQLEQNKCLVVKQKLVFWHSGTSRNKLRTFVAKELGAIRNIAQLFLQGLKADVEVGVQSSLAPFDVNHAMCSDEALPEPDIFKPLAAAAEVEVTQLAKEFLLARPTAMLVKSQPRGDKLFLNKRSLMKVRLDGPTPDELVQRQANEIVAKKPTDKQDSLAAALNKYKIKKEEWATLDASSEAAAAGRLVEKEREAEKRLEKLKKIRMAKLSSVRSDVLEAGRVLMIVSGHDSTKTPNMADLERLGEARLWPDAIEDQRNLVCDLLRLMSEDSHRLLYWVCLSDVVEREFLFRPAESAFASIARLMGGGFCGASWTMACMNEARLLPALTALHCSYTKKQELCLHSSCMSDTSALNATRMLGAVLDGIETADLTVQWTRRKRWRDVTCKKCSVIVDSETADKYRKRKQRHPGCLMTVAEFIAASNTALLSHFHTIVQCFNVKWSACTGCTKDVWFAATAMPPSRTAVPLLWVPCLLSFSMNPRQSCSAYTA